MTSSPDPKPEQPNDPQQRQMDWVQEGLPGNRSAAPRQESLCHCSLCGQLFNREDTRVFPFCSVRCQQIDLGHWFDESFGLPIAGSEDRIVEPEDT